MCASDTGSSEPVGGVRLAEQQVSGDVINGQGGHVGDEAEVGRVVRTAIVLGGRGQGGHGVLP
jgi:hypothetical protein